MNRKIRIVHVIPSIGLGGGAETFICQLFRHIDHTRFELSLVYWNTPDDLVPFIRSTGAQTRRVKLGRVVSVGSVTKLVDVFRELKADIVHTHFIDADLLGFAASRFLGVPMLAQVHSLAFATGWRQCWRYRLMSVGIERFVCVSNAVRERVRKNIGLLECKMSVIHHGVDCNAFMKKENTLRRKEILGSLGWTEGAFVIGDVSRMIPQKGHRMLLRAFSRLLPLYPDARLLLVGDGPERFACEGLASSLGIREQVAFLGNQADVALWLSVMDIFVFPTMNEGFGINVLEAMAAGKPVISTRDSAIPEIITDGENGLLVESADEEGLMRAMTRLIKDRELCVRLALAGRARVDDFSVEKMAAGYSELYEDVLGRLGKI
jgi:glycosyltransferase involved in cell wall biosynthesis